MDESIVHMRQDAFLLVEGIGLVSHVPMQVSMVHLCQKKGMTAFTWVLPQSMVCPVSIACSATADRSGRASVSAALCSFNLMLSDNYYPLCK